LTRGTAPRHDLIGKEIGGISLTLVTGTDPNSPMNPVTMFVPSATRLTSAIAVFALGIAIMAGYLGAEAASGAPSSDGSSVAGTWAGVLTGSSGSAHDERILIVVNPDLSAGTWSLSTTCHGRLMLDSVSGGYHHYRRRLSAGASCAAGDIDCLMRAGTNLYDSVTPHPGGLALTGTLRRVRSR
jgi:hypothetical protein